MYKTINLYIIISKGGIIIKTKKVLSLILSLILTISCLAPIYAQAAEITYSVTFLDENGDILGSELTVSRGQTVDENDIPALPKGENSDYIDDGDGKNHSIYSWDSDPASTVINSNTIFTRIRTTEKHGYDFGKPQFKFQSNNKSGLMAFYDCPQCGSVGEVGVEIVGTSLSQGLKIRIDGSAIGGDGITYEGWLDVGQIKTVVELMQKVGVPIPGWVNTVLTVVDKVADVADKIIEQTTECAKTGHLYGEPTYSWNDSHTECTATFTCTRSECHENYENHAIQKKMNVTGPVYTYGNCTEDGIEKYSASCKFTETDKGAVDGYDITHDFTTTYEKVWQKKTGHKWDIRISNNDATCTEDGTYKRVCANCGLTEDNLPDQNSAKGHTAGAIRKENVVDPTCTQAGSYDAVRRCVRCNKEMERNTYPVEAKGHTPADAVKENETPADCTNAGSYDSVVYCADCGEEISRETVTTPAKGHKRVVVSENLSTSTCTANGTYDKVTKCSVCGEEFDRETITLETANHDWELVETKAATCTEDGLEEYICKVCGTHRADYTVIDALEHEYEETVIAPTCKSGGYTVYTCKHCGDSYTADETDVLDHTWDEGTVTKDPTCEEAGTITYTCTVCGAENSSDILKNNHSWNTQVVPASCTGLGYTKYTCKNCGDERMDNIVQPTGHNEKAPVTENRVQATCTREGSYDTVVYCADCNMELRREHVTVKKKPHNSNRTTTNPTCTEQGFTMYKCKDCGLEYKASFTPCNGHKEAAIPAVAATCVTTGLTEGKKCSVCGIILEAQKDTPIVDHSWNGGVVTKQPTVEETGIRTYTCKVCGEQKTEVIPKLTVEEATPTNKEADKAPVNKVIKKPAGITTISHLKKKQMDIFFNKVNGAQNYRVMYRKAGAKKWTYAWTDGKTQYTLKNLKSGGLYEFMFAAYKKNAKDQWERGDYSKTSYRYYYKANIKKVTAGKKSATVKWAKDKSGNGYELFYSTDKDMKKRKKITIKNKKTTSYTIKGLKKGKKYYIRVRSIKKKAGKSYTGEFSSQKTVKVK